MKTGIIAVGETALELCLAQPNTYDIRAGGAALGTATICASLGMEAGCIGMAGKDPFGTLLAQLTHHTSVQNQCIYNRKSSTCFTAYDYSGTASFVCGDANAMLTSKDIAAPLAGSISHAKYLYVGGAHSLTRLLPHLQSLLRYAARQGAIPVLDIGDGISNDSGQSHSYLRAALAHAELCICRKTSFLTLWNARNIDEGFARLRTVSACTIVLYDDMQGACGMQMLHKISVPPFRKVPTANTLAFNAYAAGILKAIDRGLPLREVLKVGSIVAAVSSSQRSLPTLDEVQHLYNSTYAHITL